MTTLLNKGNMDEVICNVCWQSIVDPAEQVDRIYCVKVSGRNLIAQQKHNVCDAKYAAEKTGLEKIK